MHTHAHGVAQKSENVKLCALINARGRCGASQRRSRSMWRARSVVFWFGLFVWISRVSIRSNSVNHISALDRRPSRFAWRNLSRNRTHDESLTAIGTSRMWLTLIWRVRNGSCSCVLFMSLGECVYLCVLLARTQVCDSSCDAENRLTKWALLPVYFYQFLSFVLISIRYLNLSNLRSVRKGDDDTSERANKKTKTHSNCLAFCLIETCEGEKTKNALLGTRTPQTWN